jgi:hypothetical protein
MTEFAARYLGINLAAHDQEDLELQEWRRGMGVHDGNQS